MPRSKNSSCRVIQADDLRWYNAEISGCSLGEGITRSDDCQGDEGNNWHENNNLFPSEKYDN